MVRQIRGRRFDVAIDFQGNLKGGLLSWLSGSSERIGYARTESKELNWLFCTDRIGPGTKKLPRAERHARLLAALGIDERPSFPVLHAPREAAERHRRFLASVKTGEGPVVAMHPGTSVFGQFKRWPEQRYSQLGDRLVAEMGAAVVVTWGPGEREVAERVASGMAQAAVVAPKTHSIEDFAALISEVDLYLGGDTGPTHIASAIGTPVVAVFGPKDPAIYRPYGSNSVVVRADVPCSPCTKRKCDDLKCILSVSVDGVFAAARKLMSGTAETG